MTQDLEFLAGGGHVGAQMRAQDWSSSPLGPPAAWPQSLRSVVGLLLQSQFPMFVAWGPELGFLYNDSYAEILGAKHPLALGRPFHDIWSEIWTDISPLIEAAIAGRATYHEDLPLLMNRKGYEEQTWFTFSYSPVRDERGKVAGMFCAVCETTSKVLAERGLRELNQTLEQRVTETLAERKILADIVEGTNAFVQVVDSGYRWLAVNDAAAREFERIFGVRPKVGDNMLDRLASLPEHQRDVKTIWARALAGEEFTAVEEFGDRTRDRRTYEMRFNTLRSPDGQVIGAYQFVYDVTDRQRDQERLRDAEAALRQAQKMESLGQLTGGIAHDFNNLLAVFTGGLQLLERSGGVPPSPRVFEAMRRAVARGTGLTRHLLAFSRRRPVNPEAIDIVAHLTSMRAMLDGSLGGHIEVQMHFAAEVWPVEVDAGELELAVLNVCLNARDAMADGGVITTCGRERAPGDGGRRCAGGLRQDCDCRHRPRDDARSAGAGVRAVLYDQGHQQRLGSGLAPGLRLRPAVGRPSRDRERGRGRHDCHAALAALSAGANRRTARPTILRRRWCVRRRSDAATCSWSRTIARCRRSAAKCFDLLGFQVTHVANAEAALEALANAAHFDRVLSDIMMPGGVSGLQLAREIRRRHPQLPVLLTTGYVESAADMADGEFQLLLKPYSVQALADALGVGQVPDIRQLPG